MNKNSKGAQRNDLLAGIIAGVLMLHVAGIYFLHDMPLIFGGKSQSSSLETSTGNGQATSSKEEREEQLAQVIRSLKYASTQNEELDIVAEATITLPQQNLSDLPTNESLIAAADDLNHQMLDSLVSDSLDSIYTTQAPDTDNFLQETDALLGSIEMPFADPMDSFRTVAVGDKQGSMTNDSAFQRHLEGQIAQANTRADTALSHLRDSRGAASQSGEATGAVVASSNYFNTTVEYTPRAGGGYLFRVALTPKSGVVFKRIVHNIFFLIDRSQSISPHRYASAKSAVLQALKLLNPNDTFNIFIFDNKIVSLAPENLPNNRESIEQAAEFLAAQPHGGPGASTDLYASLDRIVPDVVAEKEVNSAILLSDGDTFLSPSAQRKNIASWTSQNAGKVSLYSLASGQGNNLALMDFLSTINRGSLTYTANDLGNAKSLQNLMYSIHNPIGKDIIVSAAVPGFDNRVMLYPPLNRLPNLYEHMPYVIYGTTNSLDDFTLFLQGRYYDHFLDIKQVISFKKAKEVPAAELERNIALQKAYTLYEAYLSKGNKSFKDEAKALLIPYNLPIAFQ